MEHLIPTQELRALCEQVRGECALYVYVPQGEQRLLLNENHIFAAASTIKIPALALLLQDAEAGRVDLSQKRAVAPINRVKGSGILRSLSPDLMLSVLDLAELMIVLSDNTATNEILDVVGMDRVRQFCADHGYLNTWIWKKMFVESKLVPPHLTPDMPLNATCALDLGRMMEAVAAGQCVSENVSRQMVQIMAGQQLGKLKQLLPFVSHADPGTPIQLPAEGKVLVASKGGTLTKQGILHDAAIFYLPDGRYYVMVMCTRSEDVGHASDLIQRAGLVMYQAMK